MTTTFLTVLGLLSAALLFGGMTFFSAVVAPLIFMQLDAEGARRLLRGLFPVYFLVVAIAAAIAAGALVDIRVIDAAVMGGVCVAALAVRFWLLPRTQRLRDRSQTGDAAAEAEFQRLHRLSTSINLAQILASAFVLLRFIL